MAVSNRDAVLSLVQKIVWRHLQHLPVKVFLYGSWARNEERTTSDLDLAVWSDAPLPGGVFTKLRSALEEAPIPFPVEVVDLRTANESFIQQVKKEGIEWRDCDNA